MNLKKFFFGFKKPTEMTCAMCGGDLIQDTRIRTFTYCGHQKEVLQSALYCTKCDEAFLSSEDIKSTEKELFDFKNSLKEKSDLKFDNFSNCFISSCRSGKTTFLTYIASTLETPFLYILTSAHKFKYEELQEQPLFKDIVGNNIKKEKSLFFIVDEYPRNKTTFEDIKLLIDDAVSLGYHIFIDENKFINEELQYLNSINYKNFSVAIQSKEDLEPFIVDREFNGWRTVSPICPIYSYVFDNKVFKIENGELYETVLCI